MEYKVFREQFAVLCNGIKPELNRLVSQCYSKSLIGEDIQEAATLDTRTNEQKATGLLRAIGDRIKGDPKAFYDFREILMSLPALRHLADVLQGADIQPLEVASASGTQPVSPKPDGTLYYDATNQRYVVLQPTTNRVSITPYVHVYNQPPTSLPNTIPERVLNQKCEDIPLADIAARLDDYTTIHMYLNISKLEMKDIIQENRDSPLRQRQVLLYKWRDKHDSTATYRNLIQCFQNAKRPDLISVTHEVLQSRYPVTTEKEPVGYHVAATPDIIGVAGRTALQTPPRALSQDPPPQITAFQKQQSQLQMSLDHETLSQPALATTNSQPALATTNSQPALATTNSQPALATTNSQPALATTNSQPVLTTTDVDGVAFQKEHHETAFQSADSLSSRLDHLNFIVQPRSEGERQSPDSLGVFLLTPNGSTHSSDSQDSYKSALSHFSTARENDGESAGSDEDLSYPQQETEGPPTKQETELEITEEYLEGVEKERDSLWSKSKKDNRALEEKQEEVHSLGKQLKETKVKLVKSQTELCDHKMENVKLNQRVIDLEQELSDMNKRQEYYKEREEVLKQCLADKEHQLADAQQLPVPLTQLETELKITKEYLEEVETERDSLLSELTDTKGALGKSNKQKHSLEKQLWETKVEMTKLQRESHDYKKENVTLKQEKRDLENRVEFFIGNIKLSSEDET